MTSENETLREAIDQELIDRVEYVMNAGVDRWKVANLTGYDWRRILGALHATQQDEREKLIEAGQRLAFAAGALNIATDSMDRLTNERGDVLDALKEWAAVLGGHLREQGDG